MVRFLSHIFLGLCVTAQSEIFLFVLLPTIMFDAGYSLDPTP